MSSTVIRGFGNDPKAQKRWSSALAVDTNSKSYWGKRFIGESENHVIQRKTEVESDVGDRVSFDLSAQLRGEPTEGDNRLEGNEEALRFFTDEVIIDQVRKSASCGGRMTRKRIAYDLKRVAKNRLSDYFAKLIDQYCFIYLSGARGVNADFIPPVGWTGRAGNPIQAPDSAHIIYGGSATSKATITSADKMSTDLIEKAVTTARMMRAENADDSIIQPVQIEDAEHYVCVMSEYQEHDMRTASGSKWLDIQKAAAAAEGRNNPIFKGGLGMVKNVVLHAHDSAIRFSDYGSGSDQPAARALLLGRQAGVIAYGAPGNLKFNWVEKVADYDNEPTVASGTIIGVKKTRFNDKDFGVLSMDTYAKKP